jgi:flagellar biosynthesis/type III secretory pathway protein FliH
MSSDVVSLFSTLRPDGGSTLTRPFAAALPAQQTPVVDSPWTPKREAAGVDPAAVMAAAVAAANAQIEKARTDAVAAGREAGLAETADLRAKLTAVLAQLEESRAARTQQHADAIADAATTVIEAWVGSVDRATLYAPIVRTWLDHAAGATATARVNPADVAGLTAAIGDAAIVVEADAALPKGDVRIRNSSLDTTTVWKDRLRELREAIATALETAP